MSGWDFAKFVSENECPDGSNVSDVERYQHCCVSKPSQWPDHGIDCECNRLLHGFGKIMDLSCAEYFNAPVDLDEFKVYTSVVYYPIDLNTIKSRLENRFYRRLDAVKFDVKFIEENAKRSQEPGSQYRVKARMITELCLRFIDDTNCEEPSVIYHEINQNKEMYESTEDEEDEEEEEPPNGLRRGTRRTRVNYLNMVFA